MLLALKQSGRSPDILGEPLARALDRSPKPATRAIFELEVTESFTIRSAHEE